MGGGKKATVGYRYYMSIHMGLCRGPIDELVQINAGDVRAWPIADGDSNVTSGLMFTAQGPNGMAVGQFEDGSSVMINPGPNTINTISDSGSYRINAPNLFGGDKKEGGISGSLTSMLGGSGQLVLPWIKNLMGGLVPDFRGVTTLFFDGLLTSLNPYPKKWTFRVRRTHRGWDGNVWEPDLCAIWMRRGTIKAMNGAHILYECITNRDWGRGLPRSVIRNDRWVATATTLFNENFGLCLRYSRQSDLSEFMQSVLDHIGATLYPDRETGQLCLDLLRGDYNYADLPLFTYNSGLISIEDDATNAQDDLINEVIVKWTDSITGKERSSRVQNLASHQAMGAANSSSTSLPGLPAADIALRVAQRNLKAGATSLKRFKLILDKRAWRMVTGDVFRISAPDHNIFNMVLRAGRMRTTEDGKIAVDAVMDVFGMPSTSYVSNQSSEWAPLSRSAVIAETRLVREASYLELARTQNPGDLNAADPMSGMIMTFAAKPTVMSQGYNLLTRAAGSDTSNRGAGTFAPVVTLGAPLGALQTTLTFSDAADLGLVTIGSMGVFGNEICRITEVSVGNQTIGIARGCADTIPKFHGAGERMFIVDNEFGGDEIEYVAGDTVDVKILPFTSTSELDPNLAPTNTVNIIARQGCPYPPGNVLVNGNPFTASHSGSSINITWAHRNRVTQQDRLIPHESASVTPEAGTTYRIRVYAGQSGAIVRTEQGIAGTSFTYTAAMANADGTTTPWFELDTVRNTLTSMDRYRFGATIT